MNLIHISDIHFVSGWYEEQGVVFQAFIKDLKKNLNTDDDNYLVVSGDIVQAGENIELFQSFETRFGKELDELGLDYDHRILVPGNHDMDRGYVKANLNALLGAARLDGNESTFNSNIRGEFAPHMEKKFENYALFRSSFSKFGCCEDNITGAGHSVQPDVGIYCLNTALYSFGGLNDPMGEKINDENLLSVDTRKIHEWVQKNKFKVRVLIMHHPFNWLRSWCRKSLQTLAQTEFDVVLYGHIHKAESSYIDTGTAGLIQCTAPALFTKKKNDLGYSIVSILSDRINIKYRSWVEKNSSFVTGSQFSGTDNGVATFPIKAQSISLVNSSPVPSENESDKPIDLRLLQESTITKFFEKRFQDALSCYSSLPNMWVGLDIGDQPETINSELNVNVTSFDEFFGYKRNCIISALPQFGLSSLANRIALDAWVHDKEILIVIDADNIPNHKEGLQSNLENVVNSLGLSITSIDGIIIDNCKKGMSSISRIERSLDELNSNFRIVVMETVDDERVFGQLGPHAKLKRYYLRQMTRMQIRSIIRRFIALPDVACLSLFENNMVQRIVDDFENLNLHRTPLNCIFLLKIAANQIDDSPVNRTELIERFLFMIFSTLSNIPKYSAVPDLKDSLNVLGFFCEDMIRNSKYYFEKTYFFKIINEYCQFKLISIETDVLFMCLVNENILIYRQGHYTFRYMHWINFFSAHRMHQDEEFAKYILADRKYSNHPEIIEYYSGIDRRRADLLKVLTTDLKFLNHEFEQRTGIPSNFNPYEHAQWTPTVKAIGQMKSDMEAALSQSEAPVSYRDAVADKHFDRAKPYQQQMGNFLATTHFAESMRVMQSAGRALRNSDHVDPDIKRGLLKEIMDTWAKYLQVCVLLTPLLVENKVADFEGVKLRLTESFNQYPHDQLWGRIMSSLPKNIINHYEKDFSSKKMGPLLEDFLKQSDDEMKNHILIAQIIRTRPKGWAKITKDYFLTLDKQSFFLLQSLIEVRWEHKMGFASDNEKIVLKDLMGLAYAKHDGVKKPNKKQIAESGNEVLQGKHDSDFK